MGVTLSIPKIHPQQALPADRNRGQYPSTSTHNWSPILRSALSLQIYQGSWISSDRQLTSTMICRPPTEMFLWHRHICPVDIGKMGSKGRQGWAYKRVPFRLAAGFDEEDRG